MTCISVQYFYIINIYVFVMLRIACSNTYGRIILKEQKIELELWLSG